MTCCLIGAKPLSEPMLGTNFSDFLSEIRAFSFKKMHLKKLSGILLAILSRPQCVNFLGHCMSSSNPVLWWHHDMKTLSTLLALCEWKTLANNNWITHEGQVIRILNVFFFLISLNYLLKQVVNEMPWGSCDIIVMTGQHKYLRQQHPFGKDIHDDIN